jgi:hypothetical protein
MTPYEIIGAPLTLWLAPIGTAFPLVDVTPAGTWVKIGTNGTRSESDDGVTVTHSQTLTKVRPGGATGPVKAFRSEEDLMIKLVLWDLTLEQYMLALNSNTLTTTAAATGTAGFKKLGLSRGTSVKEYALLARGVSPYDEAMTAQYQVPRCYQSASPAPAFKKGVPAGLDLEFTALEDLAAATQDVRFGSMVFQHQIAL